MRKTAKIADLTNSALSSIKANFSIAKDRYNAGNIDGAYAWYTRGAGIETFVSVYITSDNDAYEKFSKDAREIFHEYITSEMMDVFFKKFAAEK